MNLAILNAVTAYARTRRLAAGLRTRADVERWQARRLDRFLKQTVPSVRFYDGLHPARLQDLPVIDKATVLANFERLNRAGVTYAEARAALDAGRVHVRPGLTIGQSTGTSGNRGVFVISEAERFTWLGIILAKTLGDFPFARHRVALALPAYSTLYGSAAETGRLSLRFFDLAEGVERWRDDFRAYAPDTIVAPPKVLRALAGGGGPGPRHVFSGAEVLDPLDRAVVEAAWGVKVREIYMATEGLFGVGCPHGTLHLAEDAVAFEWEPVTGSPDLSAPLVTDFTRRTQVMARYRMNDLLRLSHEPCPCGSPLQAVAAVEGRQDDVFHLTGAEDRPVLATPDILRNAVVDADRRILDFRIVQTGPALVELSLDPALPGEAARAASAALTAAFTRLGAVGVQVALKPGIPPSMDRKLRRVRREWRS